MIDQPPRCALDAPSTNEGSGRRWCLSLAAAAAFISALAVPSAAQADPSAGTCAAPFRQQAVSEFSSGTQQFLVASVDRNGDGQVCTKPLPEAVPFLNISFIDNVARV